MKKIIFFLMGIGTWAWLNAQGFDTLCASHFVDIHQTGTALNLSSDGAAHITLPFDFELDGITSRDLVISNNGGVLFNATDDSKPVYCTGSEIFLDDFPMGFYPLWANVGDQSGNVFWQIKGTAPNRYLVVEWYRRPVAQYFAEATFELILREGTNEVEFHYGNYVYNPYWDEAYYYTFSGIKGRHRLYVLNVNFYFNYPPEENTCIHWSEPQKKPPAVFIETLDSCENRELWLKVIVTDLGGVSEAVFEIGPPEEWDTIRRAPDTLLKGPFRAVNSNYINDSYAGIWMTVPDSNIYERYRLIPFNCPPVNDNCENAESFPFNDTTRCINYLTTHNALATGPAHVDGLPGTPDDDIWFKFRAPADTILINLNYVLPWLWRSDMVKSQRVVMALYENSCDSLRLIKVSQTHQLYADNLQPGQTYYLRFYSYHDLGYKDDVQIDICGMKVKPAPNDNCARIEELPHGYSSWSGMLFGTHHDFDVGCLNGHNYPDIIFKAQVPPKEYISLTDELDDYLSGHAHVVYMAYGNDCPGQTPVVCDTLRPDLDLEGHRLEPVHWVNNTGETQTVYVILADTVADGGFLNFSAFIGCSNLVYLNAPDPEELNHGNIVIDWDYEDVDAGTYIRWREIHESEWHLDSVPAGTRQYRIDNLPGGNYVVAIAPYCHDPQFDVSRQVCVPYRGVFTEDFDDFVPSPTCWKYANGDTHPYFMPGLGMWNWSLFTPDSSMGYGLDLQWIDDSYYAYTSRWLITPKVFLTGNNPTLGFDMAITQGTGNQYTAIPAGDTLMLKITADEGRTWTELARWDHDHSPANLTHINIDLGSYAGQGIRIAWVAKYGYRSGNPAAGRPATEYVHTYLDNVLIGEALASGQTAVQPLRLYPNPVHDMLHWQSARPVRQAQIWSLSGRLLRQWEPGSTAYTDVSSLPAGVYLLRLQTGDGQAWISFFIKE